MPIGPFWGSKCWRTLTIVIAISLLAWGTITMIAAFVSGQELWWYQSTIVIYAIALFGLVLLAKEGLDALNNARKYGIRPDKSQWEDPDEYSESPTDLIRTYDEHE